MTHREITEAQARACLKILVETCGYIVGEHSGFVGAITTSFGMVCREFRFCGELGFGGKFRNDGNQNNTPHVTCYAEDETPKRRGMIDSANRRLRELFNGKDSSSGK